MKKPLLKEADVNSCLITLEFLESGYLLKSGQSEMQRCELDLIVDNSITCDQLMAGVYAGIREILTEKYHLDLSKDPSEILYREAADMLDDDQQSGRRQLRPRLGRELKLRVSAARYRELRRKEAELEKEFPMPYTGNAVRVDDAQQEYLDWLVCWQVFQECYIAYVKGYDEKALSGSSFGRSGLRQALVFRSSAVQPSARAESGEEIASCQLLEKKSDGAKNLRELGFGTSARLVFSPVMWSELFDSLDLSAYGYSDISAGRRRAQSESAGLSSSEPMEILSPQNLPEKEKKDIVPLVMAPLITTGATLCALMFLPEAASPLTAGILAGTMGLTTLAIGKLADWRIHAGHQKEVQLWSKNYEHYIRMMIGRIIERQNADREQMLQTYLPVYDPKSENDLLRKAIEGDGTIFSRKPQHEDFLCVRLGITQKESTLTASRFPIRGNARFEAYSSIRYRNIDPKHYKRFQLLHSAAQEGEQDQFDDYLEQLPQSIARQYAYLSDAPVLLNLRRMQTVGLVLSKRQEQFMPYLSNMLLDLCFHHSPEDLQMVMLCPNMTNKKMQQELIYPFKRLPHFRKLLQNRSAFAFDRQEAEMLMDQIWNRVNHPAGSAEQPHIVVIAMEEYGLRDHSLGRLLRGGQSGAGAPQKVSFILCKSNEQDLQGICDAAICCGKNNRWFLLPREAQDVHGMEKQYAQYEFTPDRVLWSRQNAAREQDLYYQAFESLSAQHYRKASHYDTPAHWSLFQQIAKQMGRLESAIPAYEHTNSEQSARKIYRFLKEYIGYRLRYAQSRELSTSSIPISLGYGEHVVSANLHHDWDGAHLLVTGDPYTGKSTCIHSCLLDLAAGFSPQEVSMVIMDYPGTGLSALLNGLPHMKRVFSGEANAAAEVSQQVSKLISYLHDQVCSREMRLSKMGVGDIDAYNFAHQNLEQHIRSNLMLHPQRDASRIQELKKLLPMSHMFVVVDDLDKLIEQLSDNFNTDGSDLCGRLADIFQNAAQVGLHLIAGAERVSGLISDRLMDLFEVRVCLKCKDGGAWECSGVYEHDIGAKMPAYGYAWIFSKRKGSAEYIQLSYPNDDIVGKNIPPYQMTLAKLNGAYESFFDSEKYLKKLFSPVDSEAEQLFEKPQPIRGDRRWKEQESRSVFVQDDSWMEEEDLENASAASAERAAASPKRSRGDARYRTPPAPSKAPSQKPEQIVIERPDDFLLRYHKVGISQAEALVRTICAYYEK